MEAASLPLRAAPTAPRGGRLLRLRTDDQLVALFRLGHEDAFRVIHDRYRARLLAYARQMLAGTSADAEDALQDVLLRAYGALRADARPVTLRAWLYRVAHNRCVDAMRRPGHQPTDELGELASPHDPLADLERRDDLRRLVEDIGRLPDHQRSALLMRELEGLTYVELADALGVTVPAVKSLLVRARIGLTEAREARDTACVDIRADLLAAHARGARASGRARRHVSSCTCCSEYRARLRGARAGFAALGGSPGPWGLLAKLLGLGGSGGAVAGAGGGGAATGGALVAGATTKVAALVCCAAVVGGGAVEASRSLAGRQATPAPARAAAPRGAASAPRAAGAAVPAALREPAPARVAAQPTSAGGADRPVAHLPATVEPAGPAAAPAGTVELAGETVPTLAGPSADEDTITAAEAGGMLAPDTPVDPEPLLPAPLLPAEPAADPAPPGAAAPAADPAPAPTAP